MASKHHYLSETYLKGFTSPATGRLWARRADGRVFTSSPNKVARRDGYYTVPQQWKARPPNEIEDHFGNIEGAVGGFLRRAELGDADFSMDERHALVAFAAIHHARVPAAREHQVEQYLRLLETSAAVMNSHSGSQHPTSGYTVAENTDLGLMLQSVSAAMEVFDALHVKILYFEEHDALLTGDQPVLLHYEMDEARVAAKARLFAGLGHPYDPEADMVAPKRLARVVMPLNRRALLVLDRAVGSGVAPAAPASRLATSTNAMVADQSQELFAASESTIDSTLAYLAEIDQRVELALGRGATPA